MNFIKKHLLPSFCFCARVGIGSRKCKGGIGMEKADNPFYVALGERLKDLREQRSLTREALLEALQAVTDKADLSHANTIARIENGESQLRVETLVFFASVLEADLSELLKGLPNMPTEEEVIKEIYRHLNFARYDEVERLLPRLKSERNKQMRLFCEGVLAYRKSGDQVLAEKKLFSALKLTLPKAFNSKGELRQEKLDGYALTIMETNICMRLLHMMDDERIMARYEKLFHQVKGSGAIEAHTKVTMLSTLRFNMSTRLLKDHPTDEKILALCEEGLTLELEAGVFNNVALFYYNMGRYYDNIKVIHEAQRFFQKSYDFFVLTNADEAADKTYEMVRDEHDIELMCR